MRQSIDMQSYYLGADFETWKYFGAHPVKEDGETKGYLFRTYAPSARGADLIGEFSDWQPIPMTEREGGAVYEIYVPQAKDRQMYKFRITWQNGHTVDHADPYAFYSELRPGTASVLYDLSGYAFEDAAWREKWSAGKDRPLNIYEMHMGSWRRKCPWEEGKDPKEGWYSYRETAMALIPWLKDYGYNAVELMPLGEYPADESWGYQATGFFSATSRYGTPDDLRSFVDLCHQNDIAVILDVVPVHFAVNDYALARYDGTALYEYPAADIGYSEWGSCNFMHAHGDVRSFLQSSMNFWLTEFHFDGLRFDAVSNLIYWQGEYGRGENKEATSFLRVMNKGLKERHPEALLIAEDSTMYAGTTCPGEYGGLGFDYKWNLGWMDDTLAYLHTGFAQRPEQYRKLTQSMSYFDQAYYLLPLSHDEVVHMKGTIVEKIFGTFEQRIPQVMTLYLFMMAHPGKKLSFMGNEMALSREWNEKREPDWRSEAAEPHRRVSEFVKQLNHTYLTHPALWKKDYEEGGFRWVEEYRAQDGVIAFERYCEEETILCLCNFSDRPQGIRIPEHFGGAEVLLNSSMEKIVLQNRDVVLPAFAGAYLIRSAHTNNTENG